MENGEKTTGCGSSAGTVYFITYLLMVPLIFLNLFIAIILEGFAETSNKENNLIEKEDIDKFIKCWSKLDPKGTGFIKLLELPDFLFDLGAAGSPLGWDEDTYKDNQPMQDEFLEEINAPTYNGFKDVLFWDVLEGIAKIQIVKLHLDEQMHRIQSLR